MMGNRSSDEEIWQWATRNVRPLKHRAKDPPSLHPETLKETHEEIPEETPVLDTEDSDTPVSSLAGVAETKPPPRPSSPVNKKQSPDETETPGFLGLKTKPGLDRRTREKLRRGRFPIEAHLDLHGCRLEMAQNRLREFILQSARSGHRCVLVVTGKGKPGSIDQGWRGQGVLRAHFMAWLNEPPIRSLILAISPAQSHDGGGGAFYVLLRRHRAKRPGNR